MRFANAGGGASLRRSTMAQNVPRRVGNARERDGLPGGAARGAARFPPSRREQRRERWQQRCQGAVRRRGRGSTERRQQRRSAVRDVAGWRREEPTEDSEGAAGGWAVIPVDAGVGAAVGVWLENATQQLNNLKNTVAFLLHERDWMHEKDIVAYSWHLPNVGWLNSILAPGWILLCV